MIINQVYKENNDTTMFIQWRLIPIGNGDIVLRALLPDGKWINVMRLQRNHTFVRYEIPKKLSAEHDYLCLDNHRRFLEDRAINCSSQSYPVMCGVCEKETIENIYLENDGEYVCMECAKRMLSGRFKELKHES